MPKQRWVTRFYNYTASITAMLQDLIWPPVYRHSSFNAVQSHIWLCCYSRIWVCVHNTTQSRHNYPLSYKYSPTFEVCCRFTSPYDLVPSECPTNPQFGDSLPWQSLSLKINFCFEQISFLIAQTHLNHFSIFSFQLISGFLLVCWQILWY